MPKEGPSALQRLRCLPVELLVYILARCGGCSQEAGPADWASLTTPAQSVAIWCHLGAVACASVALRAVRDQIYRNADILTRLLLGVATAAVTAASDGDSQTDSDSETDSDSDSDSDTDTETPDLVPGLDAGADAGTDAGTDVAAIRPDRDVLLRQHCCAPDGALEVGASVDGALLVACTLGDVAAVRQLMLPKHKAGARCAKRHNYALVRAAADGLHAGVLHELVVRRAAQGRLSAIMQWELRDAVERAMEEAVRGGGEAHGRWAGRSVAHAAAVLRLLSPVWNSLALAGGPQEERTRSASGLRVKLARTARQSWNKKRASKVVAVLQLQLQQ